MCFDCSQKNPKWASVNLGLFICFDCSGRHRSYGTHISFVRSIDLDKWKVKQIENMVLGGNNIAKKRCKDLNIDIVDSYINYNNTKLSKYKEELQEKVRQSLNDKCILNNNDSNNKRQEKQVEIVNNTDVIKLEEEKEKIKESTVVDLGGGNTEPIKKTTKKITKKKGKIEKIDDFDFDWDDDDFGSKNKKNGKISNVSEVADTGNKDNSQTKVIKNSKFLDDNDSDEENENKVIYGKLNNMSLGESNNKESRKSSKNSYSNYGNYQDDNEVEETTPNKSVDPNQFKNSKAISSEDYTGLNHNSKREQVEKDSRLKQMKSATAIGSSDINGDGFQEGKFI
jgi:ADP-ribosylation factor GTPase-activating protein 2/3